MQDLTLQFTCGFTCWGTKPITYLLGFVKYVFIVPWVKHLSSVFVFSNITLLCCSLKIFVPITLLAFVILVPVNWTNKTLELEKIKDPKFEFNDIDKLSISNIPVGSQRYVSVHKCYNSHTDAMHIFSIKYAEVAMFKLLPN